MRQYQRSVRTIAQDVYFHWFKPSRDAVPYIEVMTKMNVITADDKYYVTRSDGTYVHTTPEGIAISLTAVEVIEGFLDNCHTWRGAVARSVVRELKQMVSQSRGEARGRHKTKGKT